MYCTSCRAPLQPHETDGLCADCSRIEIIEDERSRTATVIMEMEQMREAVAWFGTGKEAERFEIEQNLTEHSLNGSVERGMSVRNW